MAHVNVPACRSERADALELFTSYDHEVMIEVEGRPEAMNRIGGGFTEEVFSDDSGDLFRHVNIDSWVFIEPFSVTGY